MARQASDLVGAFFQVGTTALASAAAVNSSFILRFPFVFLTTTFLPQETLASWLATLADYNPVTHLPAGLRTLVPEG